MVTIKRSSKGLYWGLRLGFVGERAREQVEDILAFVQDAMVLTLFQGRLAKLENLLSLKSALLSA